MKAVFNIAAIGLSSVAANDLNLIVFNDLHLDPNYTMSIPGPTKLKHSPINDMTPLAKEAILMFMQDFVPSQQLVAQSYEEIMANNGTYAQFEEAEAAIMANESLTRWLDPSSDVYKKYHVPSVLKDIGDLNMYTLQGYACQSFQHLLPEG